MLDFRTARAGSARVPPSVDYGRLLVMVVSSVLLLTLILTLGRSRNSPPAGSAEAAGTAQGTPVTVVGGAILAAALCVVATVMFVLYRMAGPRRVQFAIRDVAEASPDFRALEAQPQTPASREALANIAVAEPTPGPEFQVQHGRGVNASSLNPELK